MPTYSSSPRMVGTGGIGDAFRLLAIAPHIREQMLADQQLAEGRAADAALKRMQLETLQGLGAQFSDPRFVALAQGGQGNAQQLAGAYAEMLKQQYISGLASGAPGLDPTRVGQAYYATSGRGPYDAAGGKFVYSPLTGQVGGAFTGTAPPATSPPTVPGSPLRPAPAPKPTKPVGPAEVLYREETYRLQGLDPITARTRAIADYEAAKRAGRQGGNTSAPVTGLPPGVGYDLPPGAPPPTGNAPNTTGPSPDPNPRVSMELPAPPPGVPPDARLAEDGHWYTPAPGQPGKYIRWP